MKPGNGRISVYYDGSCPECIRDRQNYERLSGKHGINVEWIDITGKEEFLRSIGVDPKKAFMELHVKDENGQIYREIEAYILLMNRVPILKPFAKIIGLPAIRLMVSKLYHIEVSRRQRSAKAIRDR